MKNSITLIIFLTFYNLNLAQNIPVTFSVDMGVQAHNGIFNPGTDVVVIRGDFQGNAGDPGGNWQGDFFQMGDADGDTIYTLTVNMPSVFAGNTYEYKFVISPDIWETISNRTFTLLPPSIVLPVYWFNDDNSYSNSPVINTINFTADLSNILGIGVGGAFDPSQDSLLVMGLNWDNLGILLSPESDRKLIQDPFNQGIFTTSLIVQSGFGFSEGDSTKWKFKAFPDSRFSNTGWETGADRWLIYESDGSIINMPIIVPRIWPIFEINIETVITFNVDMTNAVNRYNGEPINPTLIEFIGQRGGADWLGNWSMGGNWVPSDTSIGLMKVLTNVGNNIWTRTVTVPTGTQGGIYEYKYCAMYPGAETINGGSSPLDNEGGFGINHSLFLALPGPYVINDVFGSFQGPFIPVELLSFNAIRNKDIINLNWSTASETNNLGFEIQRKIITYDIETNWLAIGFKAGAGTSTEENHYDFYDNVKELKTSTLSYRLKQIDYDGSYAYSNVINIEIRDIPREYSLYQNYPNPFNPSTKIKFALPVKTNLNLSVYNTLGEKVAELFNGEMEEGYHEMMFNSSGLSSGIYFYKIESENFNSTKKLVLLK